MKFSTIVQIGAAIAATQASPIVQKWGWLDSSADCVDEAAAVDDCEPTPTPCEDVAEPTPSPCDDVLDSAVDPCVTIEPEIAAEPCVTTTAPCDDPPCATTTAPCDDPPCETEIVEPCETSTAPCETSSAAPAPAVIAAPAPTGFNLKVVAVKNSIFDGQYISPVEDEKVNGLYGLSICKSAPDAAFTIDNGVLATSNSADCPLYGAVLRPADSPSASFGFSDSSIYKGFSTNGDNILAENYDAWYACTKDGESTPYLMLSPNAAPNAGTCGQCDAVKLISEAAPLL